MVYIITSYLIWLLYSFFEGVREANSKHFKSSANTLIEIKSPIIYWLQRALVLVILNLHLISHVSILWTLLSTLSMILILPYVHSGTYFIIRNKLTPGLFVKGSCENCLNEENKPSMYLNCKIRTKLALISLIIQLVIFFIK
jgi:hypothetical protein